MRIKSFYRALLVALLTFLIGCDINYLTDLETSLGLDVLFKIRGVRNPPAEVVVVAMDEKSDERLDLEWDLTLWRRFHARLVKELKRQGAALVVFDLQFIATKPDYDTAFAAAMVAAGNVLVTDCLQTLSDGRDQCSKGNKEPLIRQEEGDNKQVDGLIAWRRIPPNRLLKSSVLDHAPFPLSNDPGNPIIREVWTFLDSLAETPTLPVLTWLYYLKQTGALQGIANPSSPISNWLANQRRLCQVLKVAPKNLPDKSNLEKSIDELICLEDTRYLDFYGKPKTLRMESYSDVYEGKVADLAGKVVFVGKANRQYLPGQKDYFQTPFTDTRSGRMAGVEIMATQFANLLEGRFVASPVPPSIMLLVFGLVISLLLTAFTGVYGIAASLLLGGAYAGLAVWCFNRNGWWLPVAVPLLVQLPLAWLITLLWSRRDLLKERKRILGFVRRVFPQWMPMPSSPGEWFPEISGKIQPRTERDVTGLCLATDIEGYTTVAAHHTAHEMWELLNAYYQVLGHPVCIHNGIIADVTGDAMMAVWIDPPVAKQRRAACLAALEMELAVEQFNEVSMTGRLPTRIGLHEGDMTLGRLDAGEGSHYRAIGDTVSTASRIQGVNKYLGTKILASAGVVTTLNEVAYRPVGNFRLVGREEPIELVEIAGMDMDNADRQALLYSQFAVGLEAFRQGRWQEAVTGFQQVLEKYGDDGPTHFYLEQVWAYLANPPENWQGVVNLFGK